MTTSTVVTRVMVSSRHLLCREVLAAALADQGLDAVYPVAAEAICDALKTTPADILVFDTSGSEPAQVSRVVLEIVRRYPLVPVLALVDSEDDGMLFTALDAGAIAVVHRDQPLVQLTHSIRSATERQAVLSPSLASKVLSRVRTVSQAGGGRERLRLSSREVAVLGGVARGMTNEQIARETSVSPSTVKNQLYSACRKLGVSSRSHAVAEAIRRGIIAPSGEPILAKS